jgi:hypothetical protein
MTHYCLAYGRRDDVQVELHESFAEPTSWSLQVDVGQFDFGCDVTSPEVMREWAKFFADTFRTGRYLDIPLGGGVYRHMEPKELELGRIAGVPIVISKCGKYDDRYFLIVQLEGGYVTYTPTLPQVEALIDAVGQAVTQLADGESG